MQVVRSPHAHATFEHIDTAAALEVARRAGRLHRRRPRRPRSAAVQRPGGEPGADDRAAASRAGLRIARATSAIRWRSWSPRPAPRHVTRQNLLVVDWQPLPSVVDGPAALLAGAPRLWEQAPSNLSYRFQKGDQDAVRTAIAGAAHVVELELVNNRLVISALEPRGAIGRHDGDGFHLTVLRCRCARAAIATRRQRVPCAAGADARRVPGCGRRLRREERAVSRVGDDALGGACARPPGASG